MTNSGSDDVTPITVAGNAPGAAIAVGDAPSAVAITPGGGKAYVANSGDDT